MSISDTGAWLDGKEVSWFTKKDVTLLIKSFDVMHKSTSDIHLFLCLNVNAPANVADSVDRLFTTTRSW